MVFPFYIKVLKGGFLTFMVLDLDFLNECIVIINSTIDIFKYLL